MSDPVSQLRGAVTETAATLAGNGRVSQPKLDRPPRPDFGDYSTNAAMLLAPTLGEAPRAIAERLGDALGERLGASVERVEIAGPGFLNLFMADAWYLDSLAGIRDAGERFGAGSGGQRIDVEFVSANPTGPLHIGHTRNAAYGDALARLLEFQGHEVTREFYVNDYGSQVLRFAESLRARARGEEVPEGGYRGEYVAELADELPGAAEMESEQLGQAGVERMVDHMRDSLRRFRVEFDVWTFEHTLHPGAVEHAFERLAELGQTFRSEGALWVRSSQHGDDKDRVIERSSGEHTYFASDIAYHQHKRERGFDRLIDVWGADHHGYVRRTKAAYEALGGDPDRLELVIMQFVHLIEHGGRAQLSKRAGTIVTLDELVDDIGIDAARWFLLSRSHDTTIDLDLDLARSESQDNPVYYVQYAHARIASILRKAGEERVAAALGADVRASAERFHPSARSLVKRLLEFPAEVDEAAERRAPHRLTTYALETAREFSAFYRDCRVVGAAEEGGDEDVRIATSVLTRDVLARTLDLLGVEAPESM
ncbi:MAG: arginine--tRNA ligase [Thermoleophilaceae bacterium]